MKRFSFGFLILLSACSPKGEKEHPAVDIEKGKALFESTCKTCHGAFGEGNPQLKSPALANLDGDYLYRQIINFRNGVRGNVASDTLGNQMSAFAKTLADTIAVRNVIAYIDSLPQIESTEKLAGDWKAGERTYQGLCGSCHGANGKGNPKLNAPPLNELASWYLKSQFEKFKNGQRGAHPADKFGAQMTSIVQVMTEGQSIDDVITYLRSGPPASK